MGYFRTCNSINIADEAIVESPTLTLPRREGSPTLTLPRREGNRRTSVTLDGIGIGSRQSDSIDAQCLQACHERFVDKSAINHCHHVEHRSIGDATAVDHLRFDAQLCSHGCCPATAAMHEDLSSFDVAEVVEQLCELSLVLDHSATHFDDKKTLPLPLPMREGSRWRFRLR